MVECSFTKLVVMGSNPIAITETSNFAPVSSKEFLDIKATTVCEFTLKHIGDMIRTNSQMHCTDTTSAKSFSVLLRTKHFLVRVLLQLFKT